MKPTLLLFVSVFLIGKSLLGQVPVSQRISDHFRQLFDRCPQEKVYLHTDKPAYTAGETVWLKAYLTDATYHLPNLLSKYLYVELIDRQDSVCRQIKLRQTDSCFYGDFILSPDIRTGDYCLRAYTSWMKNQDEAFFFKKNITIFNPAPDVNVHTSCRQEGDTVITTLTLVNGNGQPYANRRIKTELYHGRRVVRKLTVRTDDKGQCTLDHLRSDSIRSLKLSFPYDQPFAFRQTVYLPELSDDFDLQFFPEGGNLLGGTTQTTAFKAIGKNGRPVDVEGEIYDHEDRPVAHFKSRHRGMGKVDFRVQAGEKYHARASSGGKRKQRFDLPAPILSGYALKAGWQSDTSVLLSVLKAEQTPALPLYLIVHLRGQLLQFLPVDDRFVGHIDPQQFPAGILHLLLTDTSGNIFSERLCFIPPDSSATRLCIQSDKARYDRREAVKLTVRLPGALSSFPPGNFSVAVTDDARVRNDSSENNILSHLLLTSDLKGHVEAPGSYMHESPQHADLLMMTHGWTRFNVKNILQGKLPSTPYPLELTQKLRGQVTNLNDKPVPGAKVQVFIPAQQTIGELKADATGHFTLSRLDFPDSTLFMIRGYKEKGGKYVNIRMEEPLPPPPAIHFPAWPGKEEKADEFAGRFKGDYYYQDGVKVYILAEASVIRHRKPGKSTRPAGEYTDMADCLIGQEELSKFSAATVFQFLMRLPGVYVSGENVSVRGQGTPLFLVDGIPAEADFIGSIVPDDIDNVGVIKDGARLSFFGGKGDKGVIIINTKHGIAQIRPTPGLIKFFPKGYLKPDEFYMPAYDREEDRNKPETDYRSTIYWQPNLTTDPAGRAEVTFYTADFPSTYTVTVEGMTSDGKIYRGRKQIIRK